MKILVVEDDQAVAQTLQLLFSSYNYAVDIAIDGDEGLQMTEAFDYDLILLDVILPKLDGVSLCQYLRTQGFQNPILLLTGQGEGRQKATALNAGADDYVVKPFDTEELIARVQALLRRVGPKNQPLLTWGPLSVDPSNRKVAYGTHLLSVTPKEYAILELFLRNPQKALGAKVILDRVWTSLESPGEEAVRVHIKELRQKLAAIGAPKDFIKTKHRVGYQLNPIYSSSSTDQLTLPQIAELNAVNEELRRTLEQLRSTQVELHQKNQELEIAYQTIAQERQQLQASRDELELRVAERTAELQQREDFLSSIYEGAAISMFVVAVTEENDFRYVSFNRTAQQATGISLQDIQDKTPEEVFGPEIGMLFRHNYERCLQTDSSITYEDHFSFNDQPVWVLTTLSPLKNGIGRIDRIVGTTFDITDRKQLELSLQANEEQYRLLSEVSPVGIFRNDLDGKCIYANAKTLEITGLSLEENLGEGWGQHLHPDDRDWMYAAWSNFVEQTRLGCPAHYQVEHRYRYPNGSLKWFYAQAVPEYNASGELVGFIGSVIDITDRKQAERELRQREAFLSSIYDGADEAIFVVDVTETQDFQYTGFNRLAEQYGGVRSQEIQGRTPEEAFGDVIGMAFRQNYQRCLQAGISLSYEEHLVFEDRDIWTLTTLSPLHNEQGDIYRIVGTAINITDRKQLELALKASEAKLSHILDSAISAISSFRVFDNQDWEYDYFSNGCECLFGYQPQELMADKTLWLSRVFPEDQDNILLRMFDDFFAERRGTVEFRFYHRDGSLHWISSTYASQKLEEHCWQVTFISYDITDRKQLEAKQKQATAAIQKSEEQFRLALELNYIGCWDLNMETGAETWNNYNYRLLGYEPGEIEPSFEHWRERLHPDDASEVLQRFDRALAEQKDYEAEFRIILPDGTIRWISGQGRGVYNEHKQALRVIGVAFDITDQKQAEAALKESERRYHQILDSIADIVFVKQPDSRLVWGNKAFRDYYGMTPEELQGIIDAPFNSDHYTRQYLCDDATVFQTGQPLVIPEEMITRYDGEVRTFSTIKAPIYDEAGQAVLLVGVCRDITDRKQAEFTLRQQIQQEYLLADIAQDIRRSLNLDEVLSSTVQRVRDFLNTDRVIIFRFRPDWQGDVITESVGAGWVSILSTTIFDPCFSDRYLQPYCQGRIATITDIDTAELESCYVELLKSFQVKANLVVPILQGENLWGLLIAHHCATPRKWQPGEIALVRRLATQVGIAIQQSELYEQTRRELSERKRIQAILEESEERFRSLSAAAPIGIYQTDADGMCLYTNACWQKMSGLSFEDSLGNSWLQAVHPEDQTMIFQAWQSYLQGGNAQLPEYRLLTPDGKIRWVSARAATINSTTGEVIGHVGIEEDITERKLVEAELRKSERKLRAIFNSTFEMMGLLTTDGVLLDANRTALEVIDANLYDVVGQPFWETPWWNHFPEQHQILQQAIIQAANGEFVRLETKHLWADGTLAYVDFSLKPIFEEVGTVIMLVAEGRDITDLKLADQKIREQAALLDITSDAIFVRDLDHHILYWNQGAERLYGWKATEAIGQVAEELLRSNTTQLAEIMPILLAQGEWRGEIHKITKTGQEVIVEARLTLVRNEADQPKFILSVNTDVTEKKQLETNFYRAQRLESLGTLASGIAHDLNNVLTPILGISQLLRLNQTNVDGRSQKMLKIMEDSAKRGANMIKQILTFTRGTGGERSPVKVAAVLQEVINVVQQTFPKTIAIYHNLSEQSLWAVSADPTYLQQVFMNLCVNARDAMPEGGILSFSIDDCFVDHAAAQTHLDAQVGNHVVVTISDTGTGISPEVHDRIFDPFFTTKAPGQGTGLGLATVLGIVRNYGGFLQVFSEVGQGTQIKVYLPAIEEFLINESLPEEQIKGSEELILVVDDDVAVQCTTESLLESHDYKVLSTNDGLAAIELYRQHQDQIQLVILDIMMPGMSGISLIQELKVINPGVKIIAMSGLPANRESALTAGANAFLLKPYTLNHLLNHLQDVNKS